jgi:hypothetical protein
MAPIGWFHIDEVPRVFKWIEIEYKIVVVVGVRNRRAVV